MLDKCRLKNENVGLRFTNPTFFIGYDIGSDKEKS